MGISFAIYLLVYLLYGFRFPLWISTSIFITAYALILFIQNLAHSIAFRELTFFVACLQLLFGSLLAFYTIQPDPIFMPEGTPEEYFSYAIPGVLAFAAGLFFFRPSQVDFVLLEQAQKSYNLSHTGKILIYFGLLMSVVQAFVPSALAYFVLLLGFARFIGAFMLIFSQQKNKWLFVVISFLPSLAGALAGGVFYMILIWGAFFVIFFLIYRRNLSFWRKATLIITGIVFIFILDSAKRTYRSNIGGQEGTITTIDRFFLFIDLYTNNLFSDDVGDEENLSDRITRINQGAIVTWIMNYVPEFQEHVHGETVEDAVIGAIFPRILMPNKVRAGGVENYERFTGRYLRGTSINLSLLGEGYVNYGKFGGVIFMFVTGLFYSAAYYWLNWYAAKHPIYIFFVPFFFIYVIKAEDDLATPLNHIFKAFLVFIFLQQVYLKKFFKSNLVKG